VTFTLEIPSIKGPTHRLQAIVHFVPIGIFQVDGSDKYIFVNPAWESITGCSVTKALGANWWTVIHPEDQDMVFRLWSEAEKEERELSLECRVITEKNEIRWIRLQTSFLFDDSGKNVFGSIENITSNKASELQKEKMISELTEIKKQLEVSSRTDPLTSLLNRRGLEQEMVFEKNRMDRSGNPFSLVLCDIDFFKKINDTYGHDAGDYILSKFAQIIESCSRKQDIVCRWGGEEFLLLLPETDLQGASALAEKIRVQIEKSIFTYKDQEISITLSLGVACMEKDLAVDDCIKKADLRLYSAKFKGRNRVVASED
jgi:diguanylate cyclase (GGDEF)-like protein/PAS domain S-box-containing protein